MTLAYDELVAKFAQTVGVEKGEALVEDAVESVGIEVDGTLSAGEVSDVCDVIRSNESGSLRLVASEIQIHVQAMERFGALLENIPDPAVVVSFDGVDPVVDDVNAAFTDAFGYDAGAAEARRLEDLIVPEHAPQSAADVWSASGDDSRREVHRLTADGESRTFLFRPVVVTREMGEAEGYGIYTDITERQRREEQLELKNEQLERFANVVSHDLRNPLDVANGQAELAMDAAEDEAVVDRLEKVRSAHERMEGLIEELLRLASVGEAVGETSRIELASLCRDAWEGVDTGGATLEVGAVPTIEGDPSRVRELLWNLFRNAAEHGSPGPPSEVPTDDLTVSVAGLDEGRAGDGFAVEDDGAGIQSVDPEEVFEQGYTTAESGTGFGLSIVRTIADAHGWDVELCESASGGARFEITGVTPHDA